MITPEIAAFVAPEIGGYDSTIIVAVLATMFLAGMVLFMIAVAIGPDLSSRRGGTEAETKAERRTDHEENTAGGTQDDGRTTGNENESGIA